MFQQGDQESYFAEKRHVNAEGSDAFGAYGATASSQVHSRRLPDQEIKPAIELTPRSRFASFLSELLGTLLLTFTVACCPKGLWGPTAIAAVYIALVYAFGSLSGAHLNPAISLASLLVGQMKIVPFIGYFLAQMVGGVLGDLLFRVSFGTTSFSVVVMPVAPFNFGMAAAAEMIFSAMLCFVALNVMHSTTMHKNHFYGVATGFVLVAGGYAAHDISGAVLNPAVALAFSLNMNIGWGAWYLLFELGGALIAALLFRVCRRNEYMELHTLYEIEGSDHHAIYDVTTLEPPSLRVRMLSEFLGTFWLVLTYGLTMILITGACAWSAAAALVSLTYALATVSGGHFNPAVTLAVVLSGRSKCSARDGWFYVLAQLVAAIPAGLLLGYVHSHGPTANVHIGLAIEYSGYMWYQCCIVEILFTFVLAFVVLTVATSEAHTKSWPNFYFALAIGLTVGGAAYAAGNISGGYLNPAVVLGFAVEGERNLTSHAAVRGWPAFLNAILRVLGLVFEFIDYYLRCLFYWIPELLGASAAAFVFRIVYAAEFKYKLPQ